MVQEWDFFSGLFVCYFIYYDLPISTLVVMILARNTRMVSELERSSYQIIQLQQNCSGWEFGTNFNLNV